MNTLLCNTSQTDASYSQNISYTGRFIKNRKIKPEKINAVKRYHAIFIKLSRAQIKKANAMTKPDAAKFYHNIICDGMNIPKELRPEVIVEGRSKTNPGFSAEYSRIDNKVLYFSEHRFNKHFGNWWTFGLMRHEMEHFRETIDIMRNKDLFNEYCDFWKKQVQKLDFSNLTKEDLAEEGVKDIEELKVKVSKEILDNFNEFRKKVLKYYPEIKNNCAEYKKAKKYVDGIKKYEKCEKYGKTLNIFDVLKYLFTISNEFQACKTQGMNWLNYFVTSLIG